MGSSLGSQDPLSGPVLHSPALHQQLPRAHCSSSSLLLAVLSQIQHRAAGGHGAGARIRASPHSQTQEGVKVSEVLDTAEPSASRSIIMCDPGAHN